MEEEGENVEWVSAYKLDDLNSSLVFFNLLKNEFLNIYNTTFLLCLAYYPVTRNENRYSLIFGKTQSYRYEFVGMPLLGVIFGCSDGLY